jgi:hypothetical protein
MRRVRHLAALALFAFAANAAAQGPSVDDRLAGRLDAATREQVVALVDSLNFEGLPTEPIVARALEGASKRADGVVIVRVVRSLATHLRVARQVLGPASSDREIIAGASALKAGIKTEELSDDLSCCKALAASSAPKRTLVLGHVQAENEHTLAVEDDVYFHEVRRV